MYSFTLDTNCVVAVDECRPEAKAIRVLADAHLNGEADVAVVAIMASEKQRPGHTHENFENFKSRLNSLGLGQLGMCLPMGYWDITFHDNSLLSGSEMIAMEQRIHHVLFPKIEFDYIDFCSSKGLDATSTIRNKLKETWRNAKCDVQAFWSHVNSCRDVFVTNDKNFHKHEKKAALIALGGKGIEFPDSAVSFLS